MSWLAAGSETRVGSSTTMPRSTLGSISWGRAASSTSKQRPKRLRKRWTACWHMEWLKTWNVGTRRNSNSWQRVGKKGWRMKDGNWKMKARFVGREYKRAEHREDLFSPGATQSASRVMEFLAWKLGLETFEADAVDAYCQAPEHEEVVVELDPEYLERLAKAGKDTSIVWRLRRQLPGKRTASQSWVELTAGLVMSCHVMSCHVMSCHVISITITIHNHDQDHDHDPVYVYVYVYIYVYIFIYLYVYV